ncbi:hypothetical protein DPSP01_002884 [Paraphaeosphaeria sporulosa]
MVLRVTCDSPCYYRTNAFHPQTWLRPRSLRQGPQFICCQVMSHLNCSFHPLNRQQASGVVSNQNRLDCKQAFISFLWLSEDDVNTIYCVYRLWKFCFGRVSQTLVAKCMLERLCL